MSDETLEPEFYDDDIGELDDAIIDEALRALDEAQTEDEERMFLEADKMPCPDCAGAGATQGGSLGNACPRCMGQRVVAIPGSQPQPLVNWRQLRAPWSEYAKAKANLKLPPSFACPFCGGTGKSGRHEHREVTPKLEHSGGDPYRTPAAPSDGTVTAGKLYEKVPIPCPECNGTGEQVRSRKALPAPSTLPKADWISGLGKVVRDRIQQLGGGKPIPELAAAPQASDATTLGAHSDAELDELEAAVDAEEV